MTRRKFLKTAALGTSGILLTQCGTSKDELVDIGGDVLPTAAALFVDGVILKGSVTGGLVSLFITLGFVTYKLTSNYLESRETRESIESDIEETYQFMSTGGFTNRSKDFFADGSTLCCFAETKDGEDACVALLDVSEDSADKPIMLEGPSIIGLNYAANHLVEKYGRESAVSLLYPVRLKYPADGNLTKSYKSQLVYENLVGGTTRVDYTKSGNAGVITVSADTPPNADYRMYYRNQFGVDLSGLTSV